MRTQTRFTPEQAARIVELRRTGMTIRQIAHRLRLSHGQIKYRLEVLNSDTLLAVHRLATVEAGIGITPDDLRWQRYWRQSRAERLEQREEALL